MNKKNIIIVGYPKSGTTWLSRLVAELLSCPLQGDWGFESLNAPYKEGTERDSQFNCFKSHHTHSLIDKASKLSIYKIIYIIRDPRDVVISGVHYFSFLPRLLAKKVSISKINPVLRKTYNRVVSRKEKKRQMIQAVLNGNKRINPWFELPWNEHIASYRHKNILFIKYEDLIESPEIESKKILDYLEVEQDEKHIKNSISNQSFYNRKIRDADKTDDHQIKLLRKGCSGYWKKEFTKDEINQFKNNFKHLDSLYDF